MAREVWAGVIFLYSFLGIQHNTRRCFYLELSKDSGTLFTLLRPLAFGWERWETSGSLLALPTPQFCFAPPQL